MAGQGVQERQQDKRRIAAMSEGEIDSHLYDDAILPFSTLSLEL